MSGLHEDNMARKIECEQQPADHSAWIAIGAALLTIIISLCTITWS